MKVSRGSIVACALLLLAVGGLLLIRGNGPAKGKGDHARDASEKSPTNARGAGRNDREGGLAATLPLDGACPEFEMIDQTGLVLTNDHLAGRSWVLAFVPPTATASESMLLRGLSALQEKLRESRATSNARILAIVLSDEPLASRELERMAREANADPVLWRFASAPFGVIERVAREVFQVEVPPDGTWPDIFATHVALIDPQGDIRGRFPVDAPRAVDPVMKAIQTTIDERVLVLDSPNDPDWVSIALIDPPWLPARQRAQSATADQFEVFCDFRFEDRRKESGIAFRHRIVDDAGRNYVKAHYDHGNGVAVADVDNDGWLDVYFVNQVGENQLWRNLGNGQFENRTQAAGVGLADRVSVSASFADIDNDGDADLFVTTVRGGNALFENDGHGVFTDISKAAGVDYVGHSSSAEFFDFDRDGLLDLFVVNVGRYTTETEAVVVNDRYHGADGREYHYYVSNPDAFAAHLKPRRAERSVMYRNLGGNRFQDVTDTVGPDDAHWTGDATPLDANGDGWVDLYIVNMQGHDQYYENMKGKRFVDRGRELFPATPWGAMGVKVFDFDNDGRMDIYVTDMHTDMAMDLSPTQEKMKIPKEAIEPTLLATDGNHVWGNAFYRQVEPGKYVEVSDQVNAENYWPWGMSVGDLNADGYEDVFVASCMNFPFRYAVNSVLLNNKGKRFLDSEFILGIEPRRAGRTATPWFELDVAGRDRSHPVAQALQAKNIQVARAVVWGALGTRSSVIFDLDADGDLDIVTNDFNSPPMVLVSNLTERKAVHFVTIQLQGRVSNRDGLGAIVKVTCEGDTYTKVLDGQSGYLSQSRMPLYFGLGDHETMDRIEIAWPSGRTQIVDGPIAANARLRFEEPEEGEGERGAGSLPLNEGLRQ